MKQRFLVVLLAAYMLLGILTSCGTQSQLSQSPSAPTQQEPAPPAAGEKPSAPSQSGDAPTPEAPNPQPGQTPSVPTPQEPEPPATGEKPPAPSQSGDAPTPEAPNPQPPADPEPSPQPTPEPKPETTVTVKGFSSTVDPSVFGRERIWRFAMDVVNDTDSALTLTAVRIDQFLGQKLANQFMYTDAKLSSEFPKTLSPGESFQYNSSHPAEKAYDCMVYVFTFRDALGNEVRYQFTFHVTMNMPAPVDIAKDNTDGYPVVYPKDSAFGTRWEFPLRIDNTTGGTLTLKKITRVRYFGGKNGSVAETKVLKPSQIPNGDFKSIPAGKSAVFQDNNPIVTYFDFVRYTLTYVTEQGSEVEYVLHFYASGSTP